jgi:NAD(P)-dependent dehydrogenase (short-subunit alcohol dehydrogenase family)
MTGRLHGKVAVVTGGDGIAPATALRFAAECASVVGVDLDESKVEETARMVAEAGSEMLAVGVNLIDEVATNKLMKRAEQAYGGDRWLCCKRAVSTIGDQGSPTSFTHPC